MSNLFLEATNKAPAIPFTSSKSKPGRLISIATALLAGCDTSGPLSALDPAGPGAAPITQVWWVMFFGGIAVLTLMVALAVWAVLRPRADGSGMTQRSVRIFLIGGGLVFPATVLTALLVWGVGAGHALLPLRNGSPVFTVDVTARQWQWEVSYPEQPGWPQSKGPPNRIDIPAGSPVDVRVRATDVIHSFWVPRLGGKIDAIPGRTNVLRLSADSPGVYRGVCAEFCGTGHKAMALEVHAHDETTFARLMKEPR